MTNLDPAAFSAPQQRAYHTARRCFLKRHYPLIYPLIRIAFMFFMLTTIALVLISLLTSTSWYLIVAALPGCFTFMLGLSRHAIYAQADIFASDAVNEGNYTEPDIIAYYDACVP